MRGEVAQFHGQDEPVSFLLDPPALYASRQLGTGLITRTGLAIKVLHDFGPRLNGVKCVEVIKGVRAQPQTRGLYRVGGL
jgi:hypothetical protein